MELFKVFLLGIGVLIGALALNFIASKLGLFTWYDFLDKPSGASIFSLVWLFVLYPFGLGAIVYFLGKNLFK